MGKDSQFYKDKTKNQKIKLRELISQLPKCAADYIYSKEHTTQPSTLISYSYNLLTMPFSKDFNVILAITLKFLSSIFSMLLFK